ncbi:MAG: holo-ACP synthase [Actinomycetota bacterium]|nr:holo-ACP synthase [Actinomycetota bacterium]
MIGIDTVNVERLRSTFGRSPSIEARLFSHHERSYCRAKPDPVMHFAGTLAAKEAVIKARGLGPLVAWSRRIEITRAESGAPIATIKGTDHGPIHLSISHDGPVAVAVAFAPSFDRRDRRIETATNGHRFPDVHPRPNENLRRYIAGPQRPASGASLIAASEIEAGTDYP